MILLVKQSSKDATRTLLDPFREIYLEERRIIIYHNPRVTLDKVPRELLMDDNVQEEISTTRESQGASRMTSFGGGI